MSVRVKALSLEEGYTLVEVVVATGLLAMLSLMILGGFRFGQRAWEKVSVEGQVEDRMVQTRELLTFWLEQARPLAPNGQGRIKTYGFVGRDDEMRFTAPLKRDGLNDALYRIALRYDSVQNSLVASWVPESEAIRLERGSDVETRVLLKNIQPVQFSYFQKGTSSSSATWGGRWDKRNDVPALVKIDMPDGNSWASLVVRSKITDLADCPFDPIQRDCRRS